MTVRYHTIGKCLRPQPQGGQENTTWSIGLHNVEHRPTQRGASAYSTWSIGRHNVEHKTALLQD